MTSSSPPGPPASIQIDAPDRRFMMVQMTPSISPVAVDLAAFQDSNIAELTPSSSSIPSNHCPQKLAEIANSKSSQLTEFTLFQKLPLELRNMIWDLFLPDPRTIEIRYSEYSEEYFTYAPSTLASEVFRSCREARGYGLSKYTVLGFNNNIDVEAWADEHIDGYADDDSDDDSDDNSDQDFDLSSDNEAEGEREDAGQKHTSQPNGIGCYYAQKERVECGVCRSLAGAGFQIGVVRDVSEEVTTPRFRTYIDYSCDSLYLSAAHMTRERFGGQRGQASALECLLWHLSTIKEISNKLRFISTNLGGERADWVAP